jgi:hypothetical protein
MERLTSTEKTTVDLIALRAFHWKASMDPDRDPAIRRWHRQQVKHISLRISRRGEVLTDDDALPLVEMLTEKHAEELYTNVAKAYAGDWEALCALTREAILQKLESREGFGKYDATRQPCDCPSSSSVCDTSGRATGGSPSSVAPSKIGPAEATDKSGVPLPEAQCNRSEGSQSEGS